MHDSSTLIAQTQKLIQCGQILQMPMVVLEQNPVGLGHTVPELSSLLADVPTYEKRYFNGLKESCISDALAQSGIHNWLVAGIETHVCVYQTVVGLKAHGMNPILVTDCISSRHRSNRELAMQKMQEMGVELTSVEMCVFELMDTCQHPDFKRVLKVIK